MTPTGAVLICRHLSDYESRSVSIRSRVIGIMIALEMAVATRSSHFIVNLGEAKPKAHN
jgi:hypothetical protein